MTDSTAETNAAYRVLARKYRPANFADLIGQEALVRTLSNAIAAGRVAHAFVLTGVRGVGKTTTARIIARALNCIGPDGKGGPTISPCGQCEHCVAIAGDRHVDVIEMDAASRTGIDDIRELIEGVRYRPVSARNKVYIIDEVHMLSRQAFNGLLKTLEEPPEHVIFVFATTEIRKVPVTVLSRCQRFDLRRVSQEELAGHFARIAEQEKVEASAAALAMIARAADGSVRDGLSLLDQAIALSAGGEGGPVKLEDEQVKTMLGLADRARIFDLFEAVMTGQAPQALALLRDLHAGGADPLVTLQDLLELSHFLTRAKLVPESAEAPGVPETERVRGKALAAKLSMPVLARTWQMLLKGLGEVQQAPQTLAAAEMVLIRLIHASDLPPPGELVRRLTEGAGAPAKGSAAPAASAPSPVPKVLAGPSAVASAAPPMAAPAEAPVDQPAAPMPQPQSFAEVVALVRQRRELIMAEQLATQVHPVRFEPGRIEFRPTGALPRDLAGRLGRLLQDWTGARWIVSVSDEPGAETLRAQEEAEEARRRAAALADPLVKAALEAFPEAQLVARRDKPQEPQPDEAADPKHGEEVR